MLAHVALGTHTGDAWRFTLDPPVGQRVALFLPFADIWTHQRVIEHVAHAWSKDNEIHLIKCDGLRNGACPAHRALKLDDSSPLSGRRRICARCQTVSGLSRRLSAIDLNDFAAPPCALPSSVHELLNFRKEGHPFGCFAIYDYLLSTKKTASDLGEEDRDSVSSAIQDALDLYYKLTSVFEKYEFDLLVVNNQLYGMNAAAVAAAKDSRIGILNLNLGMFRANLDRTIFLTGDADDYFNLGLTYSRQFNAPSAFPQTFVRELKREMRARYLQRHSLNYGGHQSRRKRSKSSGVRYTSTLFLSSPDEMQTYHFARGAQAPEHDQLKLLDNFVKFARQHPSKTFCIRPHPRLEPNRRDSNRSPFSDILTKALQHLPCNIDLDGGEVSRSAIEALRSSETVVVSWSSIGLDAAALGIPVVFGLPGLPVSYPREVGTAVHDNSYTAFEAALETGLASNQIKDAAHAIQFYQIIWSAHERLAIPPVKFSPAMVLLWLDRRTSRDILPRLHRSLRRAEFKINTSIHPWTLHTRRAAQSLRKRWLRVPYRRSRSTNSCPDHEVIVQLRRQMGFKC